jgi:dTDP-4-dehydrorhamnose 3,5-epimerase
MWSLDIGHWSEATVIHGALTKPLKCLADERGFLMEILRSDEPAFERFGQAYLTCCQPGVAKAWHYHQRQTDHFVCVRGRCLVVLYDNREGSPTRGRVQEFCLAAPPGGGDEALLLKIPRLVIHGFAALDGREAHILNIPTEVYRYDDPDELRLPWNSPEVPYAWPPDVRAGG